MIEAVPIATRSGQVVLYQLADHGRPWDLVLAASEFFTPHLESSTESSALLRQTVEEGKLGVKTGEGFYEWTPESAEALRQRIANALIEVAK